jgi:hypothetical protein
MKRYTRMALAAGSAALLAGAIGPHAGASGSGDALAVRTWSGWETWWRRDAAPARWSGGAPLAGRVRWREPRPGIEWGELQLRGASEAWRTRVVVVRLDPARVDLALDPAFTRNADWSVSDAAPDAAIALDAGQFRGSLPWGWVLTGGGEVLPPQYAPLAGAVVVDGGGRVRIVAPDARLALGTMADGHVVIALTRFDALGQKLGRIPFGLTSPEMAAVMGALGCRQAVLLDGGISGQLLLRDREEVRTWPGIRRVPLGLVARVRP